MPSLTDDPFLILLNPGAYQATRKDREQQLRKLLDQKGLQYEIQTFADLKDATSKAATAAQKFKLVVAAGGDGTVGAIARGLAGTDATLGIIPFGSGNDLAIGLNIPKEPLKAIDLLKNGTVKPLDGCRFNDDGFFVTSLGTCFDGRASYNASQTVLFRGPLKYIAGVLRSIFNYRASEVTVEVNDETIKDRMLLVSFCNSPFEGGGIHLAPDASTSDGKVDLVMIRDVHFLYRIPLLLRVLLGDPRKVSKIVYRQASSVKLTTSRPEYAHADGEVFTNELRELNVRVDAAALKVICGLE